VTGKQHAISAVFMNDYRVTHVQWTSEPPLPLLLTFLYYGRIFYTFHTFHTSNQCQMLRE